MKFKLPNTISKKEFKALPAHEKRIAIAKDVIARLNKNLYSAVPGSFVVFDNAPIPQKGQDIQEFLIDAENEVNDYAVENNFYADPRHTAICEVCALGSMFMSAVRIANDLKFKTDGSAHLNIETDGFNRLKRYFRAQDLKAIEVAFENGYGWIDHRTILHSKYLNWYLRAKILGEVIRTSETYRRIHDIDGESAASAYLLKKLMRNIIRNEGNLILPVYKKIAVKYAKDLKDWA